MQLRPALLVVGLSQHLLDLIVIEVFRSRHRHLLVEGHALTVRQDKRNGFFVSVFLTPFGASLDSFGLGAIFV